jgi:hypothetical protein
VKVFGGAMDGWSGCGCEVRWIGDGSGLCGGWVVPWGGLSWDALGLSLYSSFGASLLRRRGVVGSWWRQRVALLFRFSCPYVPWQPLSAIGFFLLSASFCYRLLSCSSRCTSPSVVAWSLV